MLSAPRRTSGSCSTASSLISLKRTSIDTALRLTSRQCRRLLQFPRLEPSIIASRWMIPIGKSLWILSRMHRIEPISKSSFHAAICLNRRRVQSSGAAVGRSQPRCVSLQRARVGALADNSGNGESAEWRIENVCHPRRRFGGRWVLLPFCGVGGAVRCPLRHSAWTARPCTSDPAWAPRKARR